MTGELISLFDQNTSPATLASGQPAGATLPAPAGWPAAPDQAAYHGLPGAIVAKIAPNTEADPVDPRPAAGRVWRADRTRRAFPSRGDHASPARVRGPDRCEQQGPQGQLIRSRRQADDRSRPSFPSRLSTGLSSGEGLIWTLRDPQGQDPGNPDKRLLVVEPEFASLLKAASRELSTLSPTLRLRGTVVRSRC